VVCVWFTLQKKARDNPPNSRIPCSGVRTLRRKFGDSSQPSASEQVKFFTMNRRSKKTTDPTSKIAHNVDVDSRLRDAYSKKLSPEPESDPITPLTNDTGKSNGIPPGPRSTRGESTENQATQPPAQTTANQSPSPPPPIPPQNLPPKQQQNSETTLSGVIPPPPVLRKGSAGSLEDPNDYYLLRQRSVSETTVQRGNARPINLVKTVTMPWGQASSSMSVGYERTGKTATQAAPRRGSTPLVMSGKQESSLPTRVLGGKCSNSLSSNPMGISPDRDLQSMPTTREDVATEGGQWYQTPPSPDDNFPRLVSPPYDTLSRSDSGMSSDRVELGTGIQIHSLKREDTSNSMDGFHLPLSSPPLSPLYDHLPTTSPQDEENVLSLPAPIDSAMRRNVSQPVMISGWSEGGGRGGATQGSTSPGPNSIAEEEGEESEEDTGTSLDHSGVVRRQKKNPQWTDFDPFEDLLGTPQAIARLRWSQELNPLYDLIRGMRISESMSSQEQGMKLYSASVPDGDTKKMKKFPSTIFEESETSPKHGSETNAGVPVITHTFPEADEENGEDGDKIPMIIPEHKSSKLPKAPRRQHTYEEVALAPRATEPMTTSIAGLIQPPPVVRKMKENATAGGGSGGVGSGSATMGPTIGGGAVTGGGKSSLAGLTNPAVRRLQTLEAPQERSASVSPRLGKRELQRRSRTISCMDDTEAVTRKQKPLRAADMMKDFSFVMREFRLFYIKMPNGRMHSEVCNINRPVAELREKLCDLLGIDNVDHYQLYVEGACLTSLKEGEVGEGSDPGGVRRSNSLTHIMDHQWLPDLGSEPTLLKPSLSFHMQGITTSRVLALMCDDVVLEAGTTYPDSLPLGDEAEEFHKHWISIVQGNIPCTTEQAVKLAAIQYQAYFLDRTAIHSVVGFCRPNEFLPTEFSGVRGLEQKMYKEQERLKSMKTHKVVHKAYIRMMMGLLTYNTVFFPVREPRKKVLQSTKLKPIILGVGPHGIMRVDPKSKEVVDHWDYQVLRNWAYSRKTFVLVS
jgi:hypothetical protein